MYRPVNIIEVSIWGARVGAASINPRTGFCVFEYDPKWAARGIELSPFNLPVSDRAAKQFINLPEVTFKRLPAMLADSLPDNFGNALLDAALADIGVPKESITVLDRLAYMSSRGMGAIEFKSPKGGHRMKMQTPTAIHLSTIIEGARRVMSGQFDGDAKTKETLAEIIRVGISAGGARAKAVVAWNAVTNEIKSGGVTSENGFEHWLIKLDGVGADMALGSGGDYGRIEYAYSLMARASGIDISECKLLEENGRAHFMTKRFDRDNLGNKHHVQSLCAIRQLDFNAIGVHSYNQYFDTIDKLGIDSNGMQEGFRRMVFNVIAKNNDDHTKNLSFMMKEGCSWSLSPAYDITFAFNPNNKWTKQHLMSVNGKFTEILREDMMSVADRFMIRDANRIINEVVEAVGQWHEFAGKAGLNKSTEARVKNLIESDLHLMNKSSKITAKPKF